MHHLMEDLGRNELADLGEEGRREQCTLAEPAEV